MVSARILYLDDEEPLVFLMKRMLEHLGHRVSAFTSSEDALAAFTAAPCAIRSGADGHVDARHERHRVRAERAAQCGRTRSS